MLGTVLIAAAGAVFSVPQGEGREGVDFATFDVSGFRCTIGNNAQSGRHGAGYNGIFMLESPDASASPFVPSYAGWNLEHYFDARGRRTERAEFFEPRVAPMEFQRIDDAAAELVQPETPYWHVSSRTRFTIREPHYVDVDFRCTPRRKMEGGFLGCFWASYINGPLNKSMYFLGAGSTLDEPKWVQFCTLKHDRDSTVLPESGNAAIRYEEQGTTLYNSPSPLEYGVPFFYGQWQDKVLIYIFEPGPHIRFAHSPSGGGATESGDDTNPAWDFQFIVPNAEPGSEYGFRARLAFKTWKDRADVLGEVRRFLEALDTPSR